MAVLGHFEGQLAAVLVLFIPVIIASGGNTGTQTASLLIRALALQELPETSEAMKNGELSFTKVRSLTRVARPDNESTLLDFARAGSAANLERMVRGWKTLDRRSELTAEQIRHRRRRFSAWVDDDGTVVVRGRLDPEVGAVLMRAVEAASDQLFREEMELEGTVMEDGVEKTIRVSAATLRPVEDSEKRAAQRRADALGLVAERALAAGFGGSRGGADGEEDDAPISGSRAERYQVMLHVDAEVLKEDGPVGGRSELEDGTRVTAVTSRRVSCDAGLVEVARGPDGQVVGAGRRRRTVPPAVRRALEARDRGCRFPGCGLRFTDAHHVRHWADGGETSLRNTVLLCRTHHRAVHEGRVQVCMDVGGQVAFFTPKGKVMPFRTGATPIDFAYSIHTEVGHQCVGAKVNGKIVPLRYELENGDIVEIVTTKSAHGPSRDWLNIVTTRHAREKIRQWFKHQERDENIAHGKQVLDRELHRLARTSLDTALL